MLLKYWEIHIANSTLLSRVSVRFDNSSQDGFAALWLASENGHVEVVNTVLQKGASVDTDIQNKVGLTLSIAVLIEQLNFHILSTVAT